MPAGMRLPRLETKIKYEKSHCFGRRHGRSYLSCCGCGRSAPTALRGGSRDPLRRCRRQDGDGEGACIGIPDRRSARCGLAAPFRFEKPGGALQGAQKHPQGPAHHPRLRGRCGRRFRRVCQRPGAVGGAADGDSDRDSGAELLCGSHQQAAGQACPHDLRVV